MTSLVVELGSEYPAVREEYRRRDGGYLVILETTSGGWGAYVPDLPGVVAAADSERGVRALIGEAIDFHIEGLRAEGLEVRRPRRKR